MKKIENLLINECGFKFINDISGASLGGGYISENQSFTTDQGKIFV